MERSPDERKLSNLTHKIQQMWSGEIVRLSPKKIAEVIDKAIKTKNFSFVLAI